MSQLKVHVVAAQFTCVCGKGLQAGRVMQIVGYHVAKVANSLGAQRR